MFFLNFFRKKKSFIAKAVKASVSSEDQSQWSEEKKRRMKEKSLRKPINDIVLDVHKGIIDIKDVVRHIEKKLKERENG